MNRRAFFQRLSTVVVMAPVIRQATEHQLLVNDPLWTCGRYWKIGPRYEFDGGKLTIRFNPKGTW
jgi:hypothetical protein